MIILEILKIIGFVLAGIVALALVLVMIVFLVPVRYKLTAAGENDQIEAHACVSWMFHLLNVTVDYKDKQVPYRVSIARKILLEGVLGKNEVKVLRETLEQEEVRSDPQKYEEIGKELEEAEARQKKAEEQKEEKRIEKEQIKEEKKQEKQEKKEAEKAEKEKMTFSEKLEAFGQKWAELKEKYDNVVKFLEAKTTKRALKHLKVEIFNLLNHIRPRRLSGRADFGMDDPATLAILFGTTAPILESWSKGRLVVTPLFNQKIISLDLLIKGRIFIGYMVLCVLRLFLDRDIQKAVKFVRRKLNG